MNADIISTGIILFCAGFWFGRAVDSFRTTDAAPKDKSDHLFDMWFYLAVMGVEFGLWFVSLIGAAHLLGQIKQAFWVVTDPLFFPLVTVLAALLVPFLIFSEPFTKTRWILGSCATICFSVFLVSLGRILFLF